MGTRNRWQGHVADASKQCSRQAPAKSKQQRGRNTAGCPMLSSKTKAQNDDGSSNNSWNPATFQVLLHSNNSNMSQVNYIVNASVVHSTFYARCPPFCNPTNSLRLATNTALRWTAYAMVWLNHYC